jgi:hypothetical protein
MQVKVRLRALWVHGFASTGVLFVSSAIAAPPAYQVQDLGTLGGAVTQAMDLNEAGQVTGYSETSDGEVVFRSFLATPGHPLLGGLLGDVLGLGL